MHKVAVIILNYNSSADTAKCISYVRQQRDVECEIIVVDNAPGSEDRAKAEQLSRENGCTFIAAEANKGYNAGNNLGLRYAAERGFKYALIINPDVELVDETYLSVLVTTMQEHEDVVVVGSDIVSPEGSHQSPMGGDGKDSAWGAWSWVGELFARLLRRPRKEVASYIDRPHESHYCRRVSGSCLLVDVEFIRQQGYFDEGVFLYCEEAILGEQVRRAGKRMYYTAASTAIHRHIPSAKGDPRPRFRAWRRSRLHYIKNYSSHGVIGRMIERTGIITYTRLMELIARR